MDAYGFIDLKDLEGKLNKHTLLVSIILNCNVKLAVIKDEKIGCPCIIRFCMLTAGCPKCLFILKLVVQALDVDLISFSP